MPSLSELQQQFADYLNHKTNNLLAYVQDSAQLSAAQQLTIYQHSVFGTLQKSLKETYAVCHKLVGEHFFLAMADQYIIATPSKSADLGQYGAHFAEFITGFSAANSLPYLADVARFEWAWQKAFLAADTPQLDYQKLDEHYQTAGEKIIFSLPPSASLLASPYPIHRIWQTNQDDYDNISTITLAENVNYYFFIWRQQLNMHVEILTKTEWQILAWIQQQFTLGEIDEQVASPAITAWLPQFAARGWLTGFTIKAC